MKFKYIYYSLSSFRGGDCNNGMSVRFGQMAMIAFVGFGDALDE